MKSGDKVLFKTEEEYEGWLTIFSGMKFYLGKIQTIKEVGIISFTIKDSVFEWDKNIIKEFI